MPPDTPRLLPGARPLAMVLLALLITIPTVTAAPRPIDASFLPLSDTLTLLVKNRPAGRLVHDLRRDSTGGFVARTTITVARAGKDAAGNAAAAMRLEEVSRYDSHGDLLSSRQRLRSDAGESRWTLEPAGDGTWVYSIMTGGVVQKRSLPEVSDNVRVTLAIYRGVLDRSIRQGQQWVDTGFDMSSARPMIVTTRCVATPGDAAKGTWVFENRDNLLNQTEQWELDSLGRTIVQEVPPMFVGRRIGEDTEEATEEIGLTELMDLFRIPASHGPGAKDTLQLILEPPAKMHRSVEQFYHKGAEGWRLVPRSMACATGHSGGNFPAAWLAPTPTMQTEDSRIVHLADSLARGSTDHCDLVRRCTHHVYRRLEKRNVATFSSALETLEAGYGDCGEHAVLLAAILRAAKVPARVVLGLVYVPSKKGWLYHAWVLTYPGSEPLFADPAAGRFPASRGLIPLVIDDTGEDAVYLGGMIGRIAVRDPGSDGR